MRVRCSVACGSSTPPSELIRPPSKHATKESLPGPSSESRARYALPSWSSVLAVSRIAGTSSTYGKHRDPLNQAW